MISPGYCKQDIKKKGGGGGDRARLANVWVKWRQKKEGCIMGSEDREFWSYLVLGQVLGII